LVSPASRGGRPWPPVAPSRGPTRGTRRLRSVRASVLTAGCVRGFGSLLATGRVYERTSAGGAQALSRRPSVALSLRRRRRRRRPAGLGSRARCWSGWLSLTVSNSSSATAASGTPGSSGSLLERLAAACSIAVSLASRASHASAACCQPLSSRRRLVRLSCASVRSKPPAAADARAYSSIVCSAAPTSACLAIGRGSGARRLRAPASCRPVRAAQSGAGRARGS
jgi:hypothetical protein